MTEQEQVMLIETEQRSKSNMHRLDNVEADIREVKNEQKAIYSIATSVELIAQRVGNIETKVDDTRSKVEEQSKSWQETERRLTERANEIENKPLKQTASNVNAVRMAIITGVCTFLATGILAAVIVLIK